MLSCSYEQNKIDGKKQIILGPADAQKKDVAKFVFGENEVYGMDVLVTSAEDGKVSDQSSFEENRTHIIFRPNLAMHERQSSNECLKSPTN